MNIAIFFLPIGAAMFYGMGFALMDRALQVTNVVTYMLLGAIITVPLVGILAGTKHESVSFGFIHRWQDLALVIAAVLAPALGWFLTAYTIKNVGGAYAAFAEVSYPLFTILFLFLFFGIKQFDWHLLLGGAMVIIGSFILVFGQLSQHQQ
jgi:drug/metabolite transporter (DMT)-like permease